MLEKERRVQHLDFQGVGRDLSGLSIWGLKSCLQWHTSSNNTTPIPTRRHLLIVSVHKGLWGYFYSSHHTWVLASKTILWVSRQKIWKAFFFLTKSISYMLLRLPGKAQSSFNLQLSISQIIIMTYFPVNPLTYTDCVVRKVLKNASALWVEHS